MLFTTNILPLHFLHIVCVSVEEVGHGVLDSFVLESRSCSKDGHVGNSGAQLSHSLALEVKYNKQVTQESYHPQLVLLGEKQDFSALALLTFIFWLDWSSLQGAELCIVRCLAGSLASTYTVPAACPQL